MAARGAARARARTSPAFSSCAPEPFFSGSHTSATAPSVSDAQDKTQDPMSVSDASMPPSRTMLTASRLVGSHGTMDLKLYAGKSPPWVHSAERRSCWPQRTSA